MKKLRFFFLDADTRKPIHGLRVSGEVSIYLNEELKKLPLSVLSTNIDGYVAFKPDLCSVGRISDVRIFPQGKRDDSWEFEGKDLGQPEAAPIEIEVSDDVYESISLSTYGASVESPDKWDFRYTNLANRSTELILGNGNCGKMIPQHVQEECFEIFNVVPSSIDEKKVELSCSKEKFEAAYADLLISEVCWDWLGYSLGKLVNSFSLAPCEKQKIWIKAWRVDQESYSESTQTDSYKEAFIEESMTSSVKNLNIGLNVNPPSTGGATTPWGIWEKAVGIVLQAAGIGNSRPSDLINIGIRSQKDLINQIRRTTSRLSTKHRVAVQRESSQGNSRSQKRILVNQNQCHSQTTNLYEVVDNYEVTTCVKEKRKGLMIKYPNDDFTKKRIFCNRHLFRGNLLDKALEPCLESIGKVSSCCAPNEGDDCVKVSKLNVRLTIGNNGTGSLIRVVLKINGSNRDFLIPRNGNRYKRNHTYSLTIDLGGKVCVDDITAVSLFNNADNLSDGAFNFEMFNITYTSPSFSGEKAFFNHGFHGKIQATKVAYLGKPKPTIPGKEKPMAVCSAEEICCSKQLLDHFNCNKLYYNQIIWQFENPQERIVRFENCLLNGLPLSRKIVNRPIAVYGQWVVFELAGASARPMWPRMEEHAIVSLPTAGLFQETLLGKCSSCEEPNIPVLEARKDFPCSCGCSESNDGE